MVSQPVLAGFENWTRKFLGGSGSPGGKIARLACLLGLIANLFLAACGENLPTSGPPTPDPFQESSKIDTTLRDLLVSYQSGGLEAARTYAKIRKMNVPIEFRQETASFSGLRRQDIGYSGTQHTRAVLGPKTTANLTAKR